MKEKRIRRTPDDARALILDAAEKSMAEAGPAGLRLQDVAKVAGVSHPTILHHFGSREGLVRALNLRSLEQLRQGVLDQMGNSDSSDDGIARTFAAYRNGLAQRILWLLQTPDLPSGNGVPLVEQIAQGLNGLRQRFAPPGTVVDIEDSRFVAHLVSISGFGDAVVGERMRQMQGHDDTTRERFERWLSALIDLHVRHYHDDKRSG